MIWAALALEIAAALPGAQAWAAPRFVAFGEPDRGWVVLEVHELLPRALHLPGGVVANSLNVSSDGKWVAFTAYDPERRNDSLFVWEREASATPRRVGAPSGFHSEPTITSDHRWIYFVHQL